MKPYRTITLLLVAIAGCTRSSVSTESVPDNAGSTTSPSVAISLRVLEYSFSESSVSDPETCTIEGFTEQDVIAAMDAIPWSKNTWATIQISLDGRNTLSISRDPEDEQSAGSLVAELATIDADDQWTFLQSPSLTRPAEGLELLLSFCRSDGGYKTAVKWIRTE
jgi:hypothetical protein